MLASTVLRSMAQVRDGRHPPRHLARLAFARFSYAAERPCTSNSSSNSEEEYNYITTHNAKGCRDFHPAQAALRERIVEVATRCFRRHGAVPLETPVLELKNVLRNSRLTNSAEQEYQLFELEDVADDRVAMRYDLTVPFARYLADNDIRRMKRYQIGKAYRREGYRMTKARYREFLQADFDIAGESAPMVAEAECLRVTVEILDALQLPNFQLQVNHRVLLEAIFVASGIPQSQFRKVCITVDRLDKLGWDTVKAELLEVHKLGDETVAKLCKYLQPVNSNGSSNADVVENMLVDAELIAANENASSSLQSLQLLLKYCTLMGIGDRVCFLPSLVRGMNYYSGPIFEAIVQDNDWLGSVAGGGRYDNLVFNFNREQINVPCVGISLGLERIFKLLEDRQNSQESLRPVGGTDILVASIHGGLVEERMKLCRILWDAGIKTDMLPTENPTMRTQFDYCQSHGIRLMAILGDDELRQDVVTLREVADLKTVDRKKARRKQMTVPRDELCAFIQQRLSEMPS